MAGTVRARPSRSGTDGLRAQCGWGSRLDGDAARTRGWRIGTGRAAGRQIALDFGAQEFVDLDNDPLEDIGGVDLVFDVIGGDIQRRSAGLIRAGGTLVTVTGPPEARPVDGLAIDFVVVSERAQLGDIAERVVGKTIIRVRP